MTVTPNTLDIIAQQPRLHKVKNPKKKFIFKSKLELFQTMPKKKRSINRDVLENE